VSGLVFSCWLKAALRGRASGEGGEVGMRMQAGSGFGGLASWRSVGSVSGPSDVFLAGFRASATASIRQTPQAVEAPSELLWLGSSAVLRPSSGAAAPLRRRRVSGGWRWLFGAVVSDDAGMRGGARVAGRCVVRGELRGAGGADRGECDAERLAAWQARSALADAPAYSCALRTVISQLRVGKRNSTPREAL
jgi:hypothetical protein